MSGILALAIFGFLANVFTSGDCSCFPDKKQNCGPESSTQEPWSTSVRIFLFTRRNPDVPEMLHLCRGTLPKDTELDPHRDLVVVIPGFMFGMCELNEIMDMKDEFLAKGDFNVLMVDSTKEFGNDYTKAQEKAHKVADILLKVLKNIQHQTGLQSEKIYLIGHSLGAQTAGLIGQQLKVRRITGLDPASISFEKGAPAHRKLSREDADLVDILHCNGGTGLPYLGISYPSGDADFYINGGVDQPGCLSTAWKSLKDFEILVALGTLSHPSLCSHLRCIDYFKKSINDPTMLAQECKSYKKFQKGACSNNDTVSMGFNLEHSFVAGDDHKKFYIATSK